MKTIIKKFSTAVVLTLFVANIFALGGGTSNADFLKIGVGGRPSAMGEAFTAVADDANGAFWNPAGLTAIDRMSVSLMHLVWFYDTYYEYASFVFPVDNMTTAGLAINYFWVPAFDSTKNTDGLATLGEVPSSYDLALTGSYARNLGNIYTKDFTISNISLGANFSFIKRAIMGIDLDSSILIDLGFMANMTDDFKLGLAVKGIGPSTKDDQAPLSVNMGMSYNIKATDNISILLAGDLIKPIDLTNSSYSVWNSGLGLELVAYKLFSLRAGYKFGNENESFTVGAGAGLPALGSVDYAFMPDKALGGTHRISLTVKFGDIRTKISADAPRPPQKIVVTEGDKLAVIVWDINPETNIAGYNVYYKEGQQGIYKKFNKDLIVQNTKYSMTLKNDMKYYFVVTAVNTKNIESARSQEVSVTPLKHISKKPAIVTGLSTKAEGGFVIVSWNASLDPTLTGYNLYYMKMPEKSFIKINKSLLKENKTALAGLQTGTEYYFEVTAVNKDGIESDASEECVGTTIK